MKSDEQNVGTSHICIQLVKRLKPIAASHAQFGATANMQRSLSQSHLMESVLTTPVAGGFQRTMSGVTGSRQFQAGTLQPPIRSRSSKYPFPSKQQSMFRLRVSPSIACCCGGQLICWRHIATQTATTTTATTSSSNATNGAIHTYNARAGQTATMVCSMDFCEGTGHWREKSNNSHSGLHCVRRSTDWVSTLLAVRMANPFTSASSFRVAQQI